LNSGRNEASVEVPNRQKGASEIYGQKRQSNNIMAGRQSFFEGGTCAEFCFQNMRKIYYYRGRVSVVGEGDRLGLDHSTPHFWPPRSAEHRYKNHIL
jgi:hypothetical protein